MARIILFSSLLTFLLSATIQAQFISPEYINTGNEPRAITSNDLNDDGLRDLLYLNEGDNTLSVRLGLGTGAFEEPVNYFVGGGPKKLVLSDLNGDDWLDVAISGFDQNVITVLYGTESGEFENRMDLSSNLEPFDIESGKVNNDEYVDLVVSCSGVDSVYLYPGMANGTFSNPIGYFANAHPFDIELFDFDNNNTLDIVVMNPDENKTSILSNNGSSFALASSIEGIAVQDINVGDYNLDGFQDILIVDGTPHAIIYFKGLGDGNFIEESSYSFDDEFDALKCSDIDADGDLDLLASSPAGFFSIYENVEGSFSKRIDYATDQNPKSIHVNYFVTDSLVDIMIADYDLNEIAIYKGLGGFTFAGIEVLQYTSNGPIIKADLFGNERVELAYPKPSGKVGVLVNLDSGIRKEQVFVVGDEPIQVVAADLNNDSYKDLVSINQNSNNFSILINDGDDSFQDNINYTTGNQPSALAVEDIDADGWIDIIVTNKSDNTIEYFGNQGAGTFSSIKTIEVALPNGLIIDKINDDPYFDYLIGRDTYEPVVVFGSPTDVFDNLDTIGCANNFSRLLYFDSNNDGIKDLHQTSGGKITVIPGPVTSGENCYTYSYPNLDEMSGSADLNNDGKMDIVTLSTETLSPFYSFENGFFSQGQQLFFNREKENVIDIEGGLIISNNNQMFRIRKEGEENFPQLQVYKNEQRILPDLLYYQDSAANFIDKVAVGDSVKALFNIRNIGGETLNIEKIEVNGDYFKIGDYPDRLEKDVSFDLSLTFNSQVEGNFIGNILLVSNDIYNKEFNFSLEATSGSVDQITSILTPLFERNFIYPNPAQTEINIGGSLKHEEVNEIIVSNVQGQIVFQSEILTKRIDINNLKNGLYLIRIFTHKGVINLKFIRQSQND